jgi:superfamily II DNA or RNA helicase
MNRTDRFIASCSSWVDFDQRIRELSKSDQGRNFERLVQLYLQNEPEYRTALREVWLLREVPADVRKAINLPYLDEGIDLIARDRHGKYWAVQAKYRTQQDQPLSRRALGTFHALACNTCRNVSLAVVAHTCAKPISKRHLMRDTVEIGLDRWQAADWSLIVRSLKSKGKVRLKARQPRQDQKRAIAAAKKYFVEKKAARGRMIMPCGTGKSLTAFWIAEAIKAKNIVVAVPSLGLIRQSVTDWTREFLAEGQVPDWICVCSDDSVGNLERDEFVGEVYDTGLPTFTNPKEIAARLRKPGKIKIVFTTYQSSDQLAAAAKLAGVKFDLIICDEAHRTVGVRSKSFAALLHDHAIKARYRLSMTATERKVNGDTEVFSMDDNEEDYGARFFTMTFKEAINLGIISDYKILTIAVSDREVNNLIARNRLLNLHQNLDEAEARAVATGIALKQIYKKYGVKHAISFHTSIRAADRFREQQDVLNCLPPQAENFHISSHKSAGERKLLLDEFRAAPRALMTNARCLTEGIDVPAIDCVVFADPKQSATDVVQASGRAMRKAEGKKYGYIVVPIVVPEGMEFDEFAETTAFRTVVRIITALSVHDTRIVDELRAIHHGRVPSGKIIQIDGKVPVGMRMSLDRFADAITTKMWEGVARANWRPFAEARTFAQSLKLKNQREWFAYCRSEKRPNDIPYSPQEVYADAGWNSWGDWLGTGHRKGNWQPFEEARAFARELELSSRIEWLAYCRSEKKPADIPTAPWQVYSGWVSWFDWLGTEPQRPEGGWRPFEEARAFVHKLGITSKEAWDAYCQSGDKPADIPANVFHAYRNDWVSWPDWFGTKSFRAPKNGWRPFEEARTFARGLGFTTRVEWQTYCQSGKNPADIPASADRQYHDDWISWSDWLGTKPRSPEGGWRPFEKARAFARSLGFTSRAQWLAYCRAGKPADIPTNADTEYVDDWVSWYDWLGTKSDRAPKNGWRPFKKARTFARSLGLTSWADWLAYCKSGKKPADIPIYVHQAYADDGWVGCFDWLGAGQAQGHMRPFKKARAFVHTLGLTGQKAWREYCRTGNRPGDIPSNPDKAYANAGWAGYHDWLGTTPSK